MLTLCYVVNSRPFKTNKQMRNYTDFSDQAILACIKENGGNPSKCTSIVQLSFKENGTIEKCLSIWQDISQDWDYDVKLLYSIPVEQWYNWVAPEELIQKDAIAMMDYYFKAYDPWDFNHRDLICTKPSIKQMLEALYFAGAEHATYDEVDKCFKAEEYIQRPWRDSGGSIDAIDVEIREYTISLSEARQCWEEQMKAQMEEELMDDYISTLRDAMPRP